METATLTYKWLYCDELNTLEPILKARGWMSLNHDTSAAYCAYDDKKLVGFLVVQLIPHVEPMYVDIRHRGTGVAEQLGQGVADYLREAHCRGAMLIADSPATAKLAEKFKMTKITSPVYFKVDMGDGI